MADISTDSTISMEAMRTLYRAALNDYALAVNTPLGRSRRTAQQVVGELARLQGARGTVELPRLAISRLAEWNDADAAHAEAMAARGLVLPLLQLGLPDRFIDHGEQAQLLRLEGLDGAGIERSVRERFGA